MVEAQRRLEPFWHAAARARYVYQRNRDYAVPASAPEVREVTVNGTAYPVQESVRSAPTFTLSVLESCLDEFAHQLFSDGVSGAPVADAQAMITGPSSEVTDPATLGAVLSTLRGPDVRRRIDCLRPPPAPPPHPILPSTSSQARTVSAWSKSPICGSSICTFTTSSR